MSHFTKVKTKIMDLESLELALSELDYRVLHEARIRGWQNQHKPAQLVARFADNTCEYDIGFVHNPKTQTFDMIADWWAIKDRIGYDQDMLSNKIMQRYAYQKVLKEVNARGFLVAEQKQDADQTMRLVVRKW